MLTGIWKKSAFYLVIVFCMLFGVFQLDFETAQAATCCTYGAECSKTTMCCTPYPYQLACSATKANYCKRVCGISPE
jgi:hypothetical protein